MKKKKYWSNIYAMLGVAMLATSFFAKDNWLLGAIIGLYCLWQGSKWSED